MRLCRSEEQNRRLVQLAASRETRQVEGEAQTLPADP